VGQKITVGMQQVEKTASGMTWRIVATILVFTAFLVGSLIYVGFYASSYDLFQKIIVVLIAFILATATVAIMWLSWAGRKGWIRGRWEN
jgi:high-affinity Fe2+/Pb2+ permease